MNVSHDADNFASIGRCVMMALRQSLLPVLVTLMVVGMPVTALPDDRQHDNDRGGKRHRLIDHQALKDKIEALRDKIKDLKRDRKHQGGSDGSLAALQAQVVELQSKLAALTNSSDSLLALLTEAQTQISALQGRVQVLEANGGGGGTIPANLTALSKYMTVDTNPVNGVTGPHVILTGVNVHIRSGSGFTDDNVNGGGMLTGLGNLVVGYNEGAPAQRGGSHNIVGGTLNLFPSFGGLVVGRQNIISGEYATVTGGYQNEASGALSSILGGQRGSTTGLFEHIP